MLKMYVGIWNSKIKIHIQIRWAKTYELFTNVVIIEIKRIYMDQAFERRKNIFEQNKNFKPKQGQKRFQYLRY